MEGQYMATKSTKAKFKKPTSVKIFGHRVKVLHKKVPDGIAGYYDRSKDHIVICKEIDDKLFYYETLVHEMIHAIFNHGALNQIVSPETEEIIADQIGRAMAVNFHK
jgi:hypothetical protein